MDFRIIGLSKFQFKEKNLRYSSYSIKPSIQTLIEYFKTVMFENDELDYRDMSIIIALSPLSANQDCHSNVENRFHERKQKNKYSSSKKLSVDTLMRNEAES